MGLETWFKICMMGAHIWVFLFGKIVHLLPLSKLTKEQLVLQFCHIAFWMVFVLCPFVKLDTDGSLPWDKLIADAKKNNRNGVLILSNHVCELDGFIYNALAPCSVVKHMRTFYTSGLSKRPIVGDILRMGGHFPVFFKSGSENDFSTDKDKMKQLNEDVNAYLAKGNGLFFFPEGQINKQSPKQLQSFRHGSFEYALAHKIPIWALVLAGDLPQVWPLHVPLGGFPGTIKIRLVKIDVPDGITDKAQLSVLAQKQMQQVLDEVGIKVKGE